MAWFKSKVLTCYAKPHGRCGFAWFQTGSHPCEVLLFSFAEANSKANVLGLCCCFLQVLLFSPCSSNFKVIIWPFFFFFFHFSGNRLAAGPEEAPSSHPVALYVVLPISKFPFQLCHTLPFTSRCQNVNLSCSFAPQWSLFCWSLVLFWCGDTGDRKTPTPSTLSTPCTRKQQRTRSTSAGTFLKDTFILRYLQF